MALEVVKKTRERPQSLIRRFTKRLKRSRLLSRVRRLRYRQRPKSNQLKKRAALRRETKKEEYERMQKLGIEPKKFRRRY